VTDESYLQGIFRATLPLVQSPAIPSQSGAPLVQPVSAGTNNRRQIGGLIPRSVTLSDILPVPSRRSVSPSPVLTDFRIWRTTGDSDLPQMERPDAYGELGARCRHPWLLRQFEPRMDDEVPRAPGGRSEGTAPDSEMAQGGSIGRRPWSETNLGTPQRAVVSPLLANVYLHYVFDLWADVRRKKVATGDIIVVRYADDLWWVFSPGRMPSGS
jgi:hypothetical protein